MSGRRVQFAEGADDDLERVYQETERNPGASKPAAQSTIQYGFKGKHSLDSDEEDNVEKYDMLHEDDIEGQEDTKVDIEEGMTFTPFNMKEELEEGHFDSDGMYIFKKDQNAIKDHWMDNIDWVRVKEQQKDTTDPEESEDEDEEDVTNEVEIYKQMLELMKPGESVLKALRRLGGGKTGASSASQRWKAKKQKTDTTAQSQEDKENLLKLTGYADKLLSTGDMEIYQSTYEKLTFKVNLAEQSEQAKKVQIPDDADDDDALDMFADDFDKKNQKTDNDSKKVDSNQPKSVTSPVKESSSSPVSEVMWEYRWEDKDEAETHGPYTSSQMLQWQEEGFFEDGVFVRKVGTQAKFYSSRRIDFDLYT